MPFSVQATNATTPTFRQLRVRASLVRLIRISLFESHERRPASAHWA